MKKVLLAMLALAALCGCVSLTIVANIGGTVNVIPVTKMQEGTSNTMPSVVSAGQSNSNSGSATLPLGQAVTNEALP